mmetsp:Transcript_16352/g.35549  ORF Transcript_16352/g.35549 Transcript_16352/m.35549 type:complete len:255 (-) Transcript_16352:593-1357(-)
MRGLQSGFSVLVRTKVDEFPAGLVIGGTQGQVVQLQHHDPRGKGPLAQSHVQSFVQQGARIPQVLRREEVGPPGPIEETVDVRQGHHSLAGLAQAGDQKIGDLPGRLFVVVTEALILGRRSVAKAAQCTSPGHFGLRQTGGHAHVREQSLELDCGLLVVVVAAVVALELLHQYRVLLNDPQELCSFREQVFGIPAESLFRQLGILLVPGLVLGQYPIEPYLVARCSEVVEFGSFQGLFFFQPGRNLPPLSLQCL